jgi:23S rRNA maturation mini-RNase III
MTLLIPEISSQYETINKLYSFLKTSWKKYQYRAIASKLVLVKNNRNIATFNQSIGLIAHKGFKYLPDGYYFLL